MFDICIIGAGVIGCAIARELTGRGLSLVVVERRDRPCRETSGLNSRVIHSGFHEAPGSLKAALALEGSKRVIQYAETHNVPFSRIGMLIALPPGSISGGIWREADGLWNLWRQGRRQNIPFRFVITPKGVREIAPVRALGGIFIPSVGVIGVEALVESLAQDAKTGGAQFFFDSEVQEIRVGKENHEIRTTAGEIQARILINSAGLRAHEISAMAGGPRYEVEFIRGDYYELVGGINRWNIRTLVYPAMPRHSRSKGVHLGPRTDGSLFIGPSAMAISEEPPKALFLEAARRFIPSIREDDLRWAYAGIRPKHADGKEHSDFVIRLDRASPPLVNLIGIDSPGLSASMGIARYVADMVMRSQAPG
jgi:glycerol-3-phosphate dehydrogenase